MNTTLLKPGTLLHGGDYNPEQWLDRPEILEEDIRCMKYAHINCVSLGIFAWAKLEPQEGVFDFSWMHEIIDRLYREGIHVILATPSGARPRWLSDRYPEVLRVDVNRHRNLFGERHNHCLTSPIYRKKVHILNKKLAEEFGSHPGVILWHISNEYGGECHCPLCQEAFRNFVRSRYADIQELNKRWCTTFWSHTYDSFDQIESPSPRGESGLHALNLEWKRFVTCQTLDFAKEEIEALREGESVLPATTNLMYYYDGLNYQKFTDTFDILSWDNYPVWHKKAEMQTALDCGMFHDIIRSIQKKPFLLMESCPSATNWQPVSKLKRPGMQRLSSLQAIAHGSDSVQYFQIRQGEGASEKFHGAVIDHYGGTEGRVINEVAETGKALEQLREIYNSTVAAPVAIIYDWENNWAMQDAAGPRNENLFAKEAVLKSYEAFRKLGLNVDLISMEQPLEGYQIVAAPMLYVMEESFSDKVRDYVKAGGAFIMTYWSDIVDGTDRCFMKGTPHHLMDVFGLRQAEIDALYEGEQNIAAPVTDTSWSFPREYTCSHLCELLKLRGATSILEYQEDFYADYPAVTEHAYEQGMAYYIAADMETEFYLDFYRQIADKLQLYGPWGKETIPEGVAVSTRENMDYTYIFVQNYNSHAISIKPLPDTDMIYGLSDNILDGYETVVWKKKR
ncbi:MAG: beta-galactosidase [Lachnospiraceae bacterium]|nr:beta-galactosidase [Lachnospiraceae bacterium]